MKKIILPLVVVGIITTACDDGSPPHPPPPPPPTTTIEPPPPPPPPEPKDYISISRVPRLVKEYREFPITWECWRDPEYVATYCPWGCAGGKDPMFPLDAAEMLEYAMMGMALDAARIRFIDKLLMDDGITPEPNRRCNPAHRQHRPEFCGRTNVRKVYASQLRAEIAVNLELAAELRKMAQQDPVRQICGYDSIKGWCQCRNKHGGARKNCENGED